MTYIEPHNDPKIWSKAKEHKRWLELRHEYTLEAEIMNHKTIEDVKDAIIKPITRVLTYIGEDVKDGFKLAIEIDKELRDIEVELEKLKL